MRIVRTNISDKNVLLVHRKGVTFGQKKLLFNKYKAGTFFQKSVIFRKNIYFSKQKFIQNNMFF